MAEDNTENKRPNKLIMLKVWIIAGAVAAVIIIFVLLYFLYPRAIEPITFNANRLKNTISYYLFQGKPHFYYLEMEKKR
ncbi:MAG: hypothetical protein AB2L12_00645 [Smithellaceae bacterium]